MTLEEARAIAERVKGWTSSGPVMCERRTSCAGVGACNVIDGQPTCGDCMTDVEVVQWAVLHELAHRPFGARSRR